jgi:hypothetical protein
VIACRFALAPRFQLSANWSSRLSVGPVWHAPTEDEGAALVRDDESAAVLLFALPRHLRREWARVLEHATAEAGELRGFDCFAFHVSDFLAFKGLPVPPGAVLDVLASAPGQPSIDLSTTATGGPLWGAVNLGDEAAVVVFEALWDTSAPVRLILGPGEGFRLPDPALRVTGSTLDRHEPDMVLLIRGAGPVVTSPATRGCQSPSLPAADNNPE